MRREGAIAECPLNTPLYCMPTKELFAITGHALPTYTANELHDRVTLTFDVLTSKS